MKKSIFLTIAAAVMLLFSSCAKDINLNGTHWKANLSKTMTYQSMEVQFDATFDLNFLDETRYSMVSGGTLTAMGYTRDVDTETLEGTYTFDGENGMFDGTDAFTYNKKDKTIVVEQVIDDQEVAAMYGTDKITIVFTEVK